LVLGEGIVFGLQLLAGILIVLAFVMGTGRGFFLSIIRSFKYVATPVLIYFWAFPVARWLLENLRLDQYLHLALGEVVALPNRGALAFEELKEVLETVFQQIAVSAPSKTILKEAIATENLFPEAITSTEVIGFISNGLAFLFALHGAFFLLFFGAWVGERFLVLIVDTIFPHGVSRPKAIFSRLLGGVLTAGHMFVFFLFLFILLQPILDFFILDFTTYVEPLSWLMEWREAIDPWFTEQIRQFLLEGR